MNVQGSGRAETALVARSETRFATEPISTLDSHLVGQGKVTGATYETAAPSGMSSPPIRLKRR